MLEWIIKQVFFWIFFHVSSVVDLFLLRPPLTISRLIRPVIIKAFNRKSIRAMPHIFQEVLERVQPSIADVNSSPSVMNEMRLFGVITSLLHGFPDAISASSGLSMSKSHSGIPLRLQAPTRFSVSLHKLFSRNQSIVSTNTFTDPPYSSVFVIWSKPYDSQSTECLAS
jgi:hypothetical protein